MIDFTRCPNCKIPWQEHNTEIGKTIKCDCGLFLFQNSNRDHVYKLIDQYILWWNNRGKCMIRWGSDGFMDILSLPYDTTKEQLEIYMTFS